MKEKKKSQALINISTSNPRSKPWREKKRERKEERKGT